MTDRSRPDRVAGRSAAGRIGRFSVGAPRVLVVEDSETIREMVGEALADVGYHTETRCDGEGLEEVLEGLRPDLVVLDVMLPGRDGFDLINVIQAWSDISIVLITARDGLPDRLRGLDGGADDYVVKPFELAELVSRVGAVLRRRGRLPRVVQVGDLILDVDAGVAARDGHQLELTATELRLLDFLVQQRGRIVSARQILSAVWGYYAYDTNLVQVHVSSLRRKLEAHGPRMLHTVRGIGYRLQQPRS
ncbi:DNA-binding response regulator [Mycobacterium kansasii]|nr:DNA-binding response regulator [Mycobacterium kansasii]